MRPMLIVTVAFCFSCGSNTEMPKDGPMGPQGPTGSTGPIGQTGKTGAPGGIVWRDQTGTVIAYSSSPLDVPFYVDGDGVFWRMEMNFEIDRKFDLPPAPEMDRMFVEPNCAGEEYLYFGMMRRNVAYTYKDKVIVASGTPTIKNRMVSMILSDGSCLHIDVMEFAAPLSTLVKTPPDLRFAPPLYPQACRITPEDAQVGYSCH